MKHASNHSTFVFGAAGLHDGPCYVGADLWQARKGTWGASVHMLGGCAAREGLATYCDALDWIDHAVEFCLEKIRQAEAAGEPADDARSSGAWVRALLATQQGA